MVVFDSDSYILQQESPMLTKEIKVKRSELKVAHCPSGFTCPTLDCPQGATCTIPATPCSARSFCPATEVDSFLCPFPST